jgi:hypothetical protein
MLLRIAASLLVIATASAVAVGGSMAGPRLHVDSNRQPLRLQALGALPRLEQASPGERSSSLLSVRNLGSEAGRLSFVLSVRGSAASRAGFRLVLRAGGRVLFAGSALRRQSYRVVLGRVAAGGERTVQVTVSLLAAARAQGLRLQLGSRWQAEQLPA